LFRVRRHVGGEPTAIAGIVLIWNFFIRELRHINLVGFCKLSRREGLFCSKDL
jgi:hypothetical protein